MRTTVATLVLAIALMGTPGPVRAQDPGYEVGFATLAAVSNLFYTPAKIVVAAVGMTLGGLAGALNGGDQRAANAILVPMAGGDYFLTADHLDGIRPIHFFGSDYYDRPTTYGREHHGSSAYDAMYERRGGGYYSR